jgi:hypothetical protein
MRRAAIALAAVVLCALAPPALGASRTRTPVRIAEPSPGNATVAGFELRLLKRKGRASGAQAASTRLPKGVSVFAVLGKQRRSDRVRGVIVVLRRSGTVAAHAAAAVVTVNLKHAAIPSGYTTKLRLDQRRNVLNRVHPFSCSSYFHASDLGGALSLGGPGLQGMTIRDSVADACLSARSSNPYAGEDELRSALGAFSGTVTFVRDQTQPQQLDGIATFNRALGGFTVLADKKHSFAACGSAQAACRIVQKRHASDYAIFTLPTAVHPGVGVPFALTVAPGVTGPAPFQFFGIGGGGSRVGPLLTSGP